MVKPANFLLGLGAEYPKPSKNNKKTHALSFFSEKDHFEKFCKILYALGCNYKDIKSKTLTHFFPQKQGF